MVEDHLGEDELFPEKLADVSVTAEAPIQEDHVRLTLKWGLKSFITVQLELTCNKYNFNL